MAMAGQIRQSLQVIMSAHDVLARSLCGKSETVQLALIKGAVMKLAGTLDLIIDGARQLLAPVYGRFIEGFGTADLQSKPLLDELA